MNLEAIEQQSLNYLAEVSNPLVRIEVLHAHLRDRGLAETMDTAQLTAFLARHELFRVMQPALSVPDVDGADAGASTGGYVILASRVPSPEEISGMMLEQLDTLEAALASARAQALEVDDPARVGPIEEALRRLASLRKKLAAPPDSSKN